MNITMPYKASTERKTSHRSRANLTLALNNAVNNIRNLKPSRSRPRSLRKSLLSPHACISHSIQLSLSLSSYLASAGSLSPMIENRWPSDEAHDINMISPWDTDRAIVEIDDNCDKPEPPIKLIAFSYL